MKEEVRGAIDCDPETWAIMAVNPMDGGFEEYWSAACGAPVNERIAYAIRRRSDGLVIYVFNSEWIRAIDGVRLR